MPRAGSTAEERFEKRRLSIIAQQRRFMVSRAFEGVMPGTIALLQRARKARDVSMDALLYQLVRKVSRP